MPSDSDPGSVFNFPPLMVNDRIWGGEAGPKSVVLYYYIHSVGSLLTLLSHSVTL